MQISLEEQRHHVAKPHSPTLVCSCRPVGPRQKWCFQASKVHIGPWARERFTYHLPERRELGSKGSLVNNWALVPGVFSHVHWLFVLVGACQPPHTASLTLAVSARMLPGLQVPGAEPGSVIWSGAWYQIGTVISDPLRSQLRTRASPSPASLFW